MSHYLQDKQEFNMFEIEHYFGYDYLNDNMMIKRTAIPNIFEILSNKKTSFATKICKVNDPNTFRYFTDLFRIIDRICKIEISYIV